VSEALAVYVREHEDVRGARALVPFLVNPGSRVAALLQCGDVRAAADVATGDGEGAPAHAQAVLNALRGLPPSKNVQYASTVCEAFLSPYLEH